MDAESTTSRPEPPPRSASHASDPAAAGSPARWGGLSDRWFGGARAPHRLDILDLLGPVRNKRVLEVGCGRSPYLTELAARGAREAVGIDPIASRLGLAESAAALRGVVERCRFACTDFLRAELTGPFDACVAIGYFDVLPDPVVHLRRMVALTRGDLLASFPQRFTLRALLRAISHRLRGRRLRPFTMSELRQLARSAGLEDVQIYATRGDLLLHARSRGGHKNWPADTTRHGTGQKVGEQEQPPESRIKCTGHDSRPSWNDGLHAG